MWPAYGGRKNYAGEDQLGWQRTRIKEDRIIQIFYGRNCLPLSFWFILSFRSNIKDANIFTEFSAIRFHCHSCCHGPRGVWLEM